MNDWTEKLSDYLDDEMSGEERARLEEALERDAELRGVLDELRGVRDAASALPHAGPSRDLWPGIESRIAAPDEAVVDLAKVRGTRRRISFSVPQLAAAAVAALVLGSAGMWALMSADANGTGSGNTVAVAPDSDTQVLSAADGEEPFSYEATIRDLEAQLEVGRDRLDPKTVAALEGSLATIDRAIARAQRALEEDPASLYLNHHLADARTRKLRVLQQAARLASS